MLKLKQESSATLSQFHYYFEDQKGKRTQISYCFPPCAEMKNNPDKVFAYGGSYREFENDGENVKFTVFLVGTSRDTDSLYRVFEKCNPLEVMKNNRIEVPD